MNEDKEPIIPQSAKEIVSDDTDDETEVDKKESSAIELPLIDPVVALCAPDATPNSMEPLHPSQVPEPEHKTEVKVADTSTPSEGPTTPDQALRVMMGMASPKAQTAPVNVESMLSIPGIETGSAPINESALMSAVGSGMPDPQAPTDIKKTMDVYRKFGGPR